MLVLVFHLLFHKWALAFGPETLRSNFDPYLEPKCGPFGITHPYQDWNPYLTDYNSSLAFCDIQSAFPFLDHPPTSSSDPSAMLGAPDEFLSDDTYAGIAGYAGSLSDDVYGAPDESLSDVYVAHGESLSHDVYGAPDKSLSHAVYGGQVDYTGHVGSLNDDVYVAHDESLSHAGHDSLVDHAGYDGSVEAPECGLSDGKGSLNAFKSNLKYDLFLVRRNHVKIALLQKFNAVIGGNHAVISWEKVDVQNWPPKVVFYSPKLWTKEDISALEASLETINFVPTTRSGNVESSAAELYRRLGRLYMEVYMSPVINWRKHLKAVCPELHLVTPEQTLWKSKDLVQVEKVIERLEAIKNESNGGLKRKVEMIAAMDYKCYVRTRKSKLGTLLLGVFTLQTRQHKIDWNRYEILNWPESVIFYRPMSWNVSDLDAIQAAIPNLVFRKIQSALAVPPVKTRVQLYRKLAALCKAYFGLDYIPWINGLDDLVPNFHLTSAQWEHWTHRDVCVIQRLVDILSAPFKDKSMFPWSDLTTGRQYIHNQLLRKYRETIVMGDKIFWSAVEAVGWPEDVLFYSHEEWTYKDIVSLYRHLDSISFVRRTNPGPFIVDKLALVMTEKLIEISKVHFNARGTTVPWAKFKKQIKSLHVFNSSASVAVTEHFSQVKAIFAHYGIDPAELWKRNAKTKRELPSSQTEPISLSKKSRPSVTKPRVKRK